MKRGWVVAHPAPSEHSKLAARASLPVRYRQTHCIDRELSGNTPEKALVDIMQSLRRLVNPHPVPDCAKLTRVDDRILSDLIALRRAGAGQRERLDAAGIPALIVLEQERQRREASRREVAS